MKKYDLTYKLINKKAVLNIYGTNINFKTHKHNF